MSVFAIYPYLRDRRVVGAARFSNAGPRPVVNLLDRLAPGKPIVMSWHLRPQRRGTTRLADRIERRMLLHAVHQALHHST
jgi:hypothetical protein